MQKLTERQKFSNEVEITTSKIKRNLMLDDLSYNTFIFELGIKLLDQHFPEDSLVYQPHFQAHATSKAYWRWFANEWNLCQFEILSFIEKEPNLKPRQLLTMEVELFIQSKNINTSFTHYIKLYGIV